MLLVMKTAVESTRRIAGGVLTAIGAAVWLLDQLGRWQTFMSLRTIAAYPWLTPLLIIAGIGFLAWSDYKKTKPVLYSADGSLIQPRFVTMLSKDALVAVITGAVLAGSLFLGIILLRYYELIEPQEEINSAFNVVPGTTWVSLERGRSPFLIEYNGNILCPADVAQSLVITNRKPSQAMVSTMSLEVRSHNGWLIKKWAHLTKLPARPGQRIFWVWDFSGKPQDAKMLTFDSFLDSKIENQTLIQGQSVKGWTFYEAPKGYNDFPRPLRFRITLTNTAGDKTIQEWTDLGGDSTISTLMHLEPFSGFDPQQYRLKFYSEP